MEETPSVGPARRSLFQGGTVAGTSALVSWLRSLLLATVLAAVCIASVPARGEHGDAKLVGDSVSYVAMVLGSSAAPAPFRYRIVVPAIARGLPLAPARALALVSLLSLVATYALVLRTSRRLGVPDKAAITGLVTAVCSAPHLYSYENPYLTDAMALLAVSACLYALVAGRFRWFTALCVLAMGIRETSIFAAPAWASTGQRLRAVLVVTSSLAAYVMIHRFVGPHSATDPGPFKEFPARPLHDVVADLFSAWHGLWFALPVGLLLLPTRRREVAGMACSLCAGTLLTSFLATDTTRMAAPLFPVVAIGVGAFVATSWKESPLLTALLVGGSIASAAIWQPLRSLPHPTVVSQSWRVLTVTVLAVLGLAGAARLRTRPRGIRVAPPPARATASPKACARATSD